MTSKKQPPADARVAVIPADQESRVGPVAQPHGIDALESTLRKTIDVRQPNRLWSIVLLLGWIFDFLFWERAVGINFALFSTFCLLGGMVLLFAEGHRPARASL